MVNARFIADQVCGALSVVAFALMLLPQVVLNYRRGSTEGLAPFLVILWHVYTLLFIPYVLVQKLPLALFLQFAAFCALSIVLECQIVYYKTPRASYLRVIFSALMYTALSLATVIGLYYLFECTKGTPVGDGLIIGLGCVGSSICLGLGFLPQIHEMCKTKSSEGFSLGVTFLDIIGSSLSIVTILLGDEALDLGGLLPYIIIIGFQILVFTLAVFVYPRPKKTVEVNLVDEEQPPNYDVEAKVSPREPAA